MIITKDFVFIHTPKTGGTFIESIIQRVYQRTGMIGLFASGIIPIYYSKRRYYKHYIFDHYVYGTIETLGQHGTCEFIPPIFKNKKKLSVIRSPFDKWVSLYHYRWWDRHPLIESEVIRKRFPHYPELSFKDYYLLENENFMRFQLGDSYRSDIGALSWQFIRFYFKNPLEVYNKITFENYMGVTKTNMFNVHFLRMESLNDQLHSFLLSLGFEPDQIEFVKSSEKVLPPNSTRKTNCSWQHELDNEDIDQIIRNEWLLFQLFPNYRP